MLNLNVTRLYMGGAEFTYSLPEPFGMDGGKAFIRIVAKPATAANMDFQIAAEGALRAAKIADMQRNKAYEKSGDEEALIASQERDEKRFKEMISGIRYDHCIVEWETDIQNGDKAMEPTRENFVALSQFRHRDVQAVFAKMAADLEDHAKFAAEAEREVDEAEVKN